MGTREVSGQAVAILRARHGASKAIAFEVLVPPGSGALTEIRDMAIVIAARVPTD